DVTGFGLLGHLHEVTAGSSVGADISFHRVPILSEVIDLAAQGIVPGGTKRNLAFAEGFASFDDGIDPAQRLVLADAQTSGGLLLFGAPDRAAALLDALHEQGVPVFADIGVITDDPSGRIRVRA